MGVGDGSRRADLLEAGLALALKLMCVDDTFYQRNKHIGLEDGGVGLVDMRRPGTLFAERVR